MEGLTVDRSANDILLTYLFFLHCVEKTVADIRPPAAPITFMWILFFNFYFQFFYSLPNVKWCPAVAKVVNR
jgi:hypothetical protein